MHMSDALLTPLVGGTMLATGSGTIGYSIRNLKNETFEERIPLMGVMGAFLFAAQMINFAIPGTGSSGHIGGGMLLAIILGPAAGFLTMASVLLIQAMFFADGGWLAFGCNLINLGFFTAYVAYPLIFKPMTRKVMTRKRLIFAAILASIVGLQLGSLGVVLETVLSGKTELPFMTFLLFMQPIHLAIGIVEGVITGVIVAFLYKENPSLVYTKDQENNVKTSENSRKTIIGILLLAIIIGGGFSLLASGNPDGLEWAIFQTSGSEELHNSSGIVSWFNETQQSIALMPDYMFKGGSSETAGTSASGIIGSFIVLGLTTGIALIVKKRKEYTSHE